MLTPAVALGQLPLTLNTARSAPESGGASRKCVSAEGRIGWRQEEEASG